jgi:DNA-directed RNA polymerase specialized sigma24 family protein
VLEPGPKSRAEIEPWEWELVAQVARSFRATDPEDLRAELRQTLLELKRRRSPGIRHWRGYLAKALHNKASNLVRDLRRREKREQSFDPSESQPFESNTPMRDDIWAAPETDQGLALDFARVWRTLDPELRSFWEALLEEEGNQSRVARRLKLHRNTVRLWKRRIEEILRRHGFQDQ